MTSGMKSSEFWLTLAALGLVAFGPKIGLDLDLKEILGIFVGTGGYAMGRGMAKKK